MKDSQELAQDLLHLGRPQGCEIVRKGRKPVVTRNGSTFEPGGVPLSQCWCQRSGADNVGAVLASRFGKVQTREEAQPPKDAPGPLSKHSPVAEAYLQQPGNEIGRFGAIRTGLSLLLPVPLQRAGTLTSDDRRRHRRGVRGRCVAWLG